MIKVFLVIAAVWGGADPPQGKNGLRHQHVIEQPSLEECLRLVAILDALPPLSGGTVFRARCRLTLEQ